MELTKLSSDQNERERENSFRTQLKEYKAKSAAKHTKCTIDQQPITNQHGTMQPSNAHKKKHDIREVTRIGDLVLAIAYPMEFVSELPATTFVGTWYLSPEYHLIESLVVIFFALVILAMNPCPTASYTSLNPSSKQSEYLDLVKYVMILDYVLHVAYKVSDVPKPRGLWWLFQPCPMNQLAIIYLLHFPDKLTIELSLNLLTLTCLTCNALAMPDFGKKKYLQSLFLPHYYLQHILILVLPWYWFIHYADILAPILSMACVARTFAYCLLYQFYVMEVAAIVSGVNINYCMSPPKALAFCGKNYRIVSILVLFPLHALTGFIVPGLFASIL